MSPRNGKAPRKPTAKDKGETHYPKRIFLEQVPRVSKMLSPGHALALLVLHRIMCGRRITEVEMSGESLGTMLGVDAGHARNLLLDMERGASSRRKSRLPSQTLSRHRASSSPTSTGSTSPSGQRNSSTTSLSLTSFSTLRSGRW